MLEQYGVDSRDIRNMQIVFVVMTFVMSFLIDAPLFPRFVAAMFMALFSAVSFLVVTILLNKFDLAY